VLGWAIVFLIVALIVCALGFGVAAQAAFGAAIALLPSFVSTIVGNARGGAPACDRRGDTIRL
jgi:uncharacterized membrane protein YtjA (UPF0391 family)